MRGVGEEEEVEMILIQCIYERHFQNVNKKLT